MILGGRSFNFENICNYIQIIFLCVNFDILSLLRALSISSRLSNVWAYRFSYFSLIILLISKVSVVIPLPLTFLILVIYTLYLRVIRLVDVSQFYWFFQIMHFWLHWFSLLLSCFQIHRFLHLFLLVTLFWLFWT